jgi:hypothetical protein
LRTEELVDVISQDIGVRQHHVHCSALFASSREHVSHAVTTLDLLNQSVLDGTCIGVEESRSFSTEVLKNFKTFVADSA